jgi:hypothetical protein
MVKSIKKASPARRKNEPKPAVKRVLCPECNGIKSTAYCLCKGKGKIKDSMLVAVRTIIGTVYMSYRDYLDNLERQIKKS